MIAGARESARYSHPFNVSPSIVLKLMSLRLFAIFETGRAHRVVESSDKDCQNPQSGRYLLGFSAPHSVKATMGCTEPPTNSVRSLSFGSKLRPSFRVAERRGSLSFPDIVPVRHHTETFVSIGKRSRGGVFLLLRYNRTTTAGSTASALVLVPSLSSTVGNHQYAGTISNE